MVRCIVPLCADVETEMTHAAAPSAVILFTIPHRRKKSNDFPENHTVRSLKDSAFDEAVKKRSPEFYASVVSMTSSGLMRMEVKQMRTLINVTIKPV